MTSGFARLVLFVFIGLYSCNAGAQKPHGEGPIEWMTWQEAMEKQKTAPRKIFIDMYTSWCGWCKRMDATTFQDSAVAAILNDKFYAVKMDAETHDTLVYQGKDYVFKPEYKSNELAVKLLNGQMSFPTAVYLDERQFVISPVAGYMTAEQVLPILHYFGDNIYLTRSWEDYAGKH